MPFVSKLFHNWHCKRLLRTDPLKALIVRRVRSRPVDARRRVLVRRGRAGEDPALDGVPALRGSWRALRGVCRRSLYDVKLVVLFLDA